MAKPRIHERDAYITRERRGGTSVAYSTEAEIFHGLYPPFRFDGPGVLTKEQAELLTERAYAKFAPNRKRPRLNMPRYRLRKLVGGASYTVSTHTIWAPAGGLDESMLLHEIAHSLTWHDNWTGHGPEFFRVLIELNCWHLKMDVTQRLKLTREHHGIAVADKLKLGRDPTKVDWIRRKR